MLAKKIEQELLHLKALDQPHPEIEEKWVEESEKRHDAYKAGKLKGVPLEEIKERSEMRNRHNLYVEQK